MRSMRSCARVPFSLVTVTRVPSIAALRARARRRYLLYPFFFGAPFFIESRAVLDGG